MPTAPAPAAGSLVQLRSAGDKDVDDIRTLMEEVRSAHAFSVACHYTWASTALHGAFAMRRGRAHSTCAPLSPCRRCAPHTQVDMRIAETKRATYEFKRDIIMGGEDALSGGVSADKITRCGAAAAVSGHMPRRLAACICSSWCCQG